jgi:hypothetical protein
MSSAARRAIIRSQSPLERAARYLLARRVHKHAGGTREPWKPRLAESQNVHVTTSCCSKGACEKRLARDFLSAR